MESAQQFMQFFTQNQAAFIALSIWSLIWKGFALWRASRNNQRNWFIALLVLNTMGILEMVYLFWISKKTVSGNTEPIDDKI
ncbi:MAG: hypothetical protein UX66_C0028G0001 [Parcubacteria group bacterium GW2011_GWF2_46_8]|nr:MAG: hypothetical protein UX66_C0028G0001 [Parcubacteria group bacterium GW2011_GWF2_46_8]